MTPVPAHSGTCCTASERTSQRAFLCISAAALRRVRGDHDRLVRVDVRKGRSGDARRLDDVDGVDADAAPNLTWQRGVVLQHVDGHDGRDDAAILDADALALSRGRRQERRAAPGSADNARWRRVFLGVGGDWRRGISRRRCAGGDRNATAGAGRRRPDRRGRGGRDRRCAAVQRLEGASPCLLPGSAGARTHLAGGCRLGLAARSAPRTSLQLLLCRLDHNPIGHRSHGLAHDGSRDRGEHSRTIRAAGRPRCASPWKLLPLEQDCS